MNNEILEIAKYLKNKITSGEGVDEYNWQEIIDVCNEIERINDLKPIGYIPPVGLVNIRRNQPVILSQFNKLSTIPLYRLDKQP
ncbi:hypothetical protein ACOJ84_003983 [Morganella morganii]|uniref:hypothetical protein n=1 Tax=Morganella morganii TaxID=582 RepID=UPI00056363C1|nr:hypothetical protein [Morganella morganii]EJG2201554.1 hypothetical protein [Morganella morganii]ELN8405939.1 hypothetical protein [Morganella morganii]MBT0400426.1 hypothetical protein [Morganella morganii subsp. morganii]MDS0906559.1 hypothetical protein [Morganella morganii]OPL25448.1 hypothetical protein B5S45_09740 [Morganella morganii]